LSHNLAGVDPAGRKPFVSQNVNRRRQPITERAHRVQRLRISVHRLPDPQLNKLPITCPTVLVLIRSSVAVMRAVDGADTYADMHGHAWDRAHHAA
jgi:hypothetical protein